MTTIVIDTVENGGTEAGYDDENVFIASTGGLINNDGTALQMTADSGDTVQLTVGGFIYGDADGVDFLANNGNANFAINGSVQGTNDGLSLALVSSESTGNATITLGPQASVSGSFGVYDALASTSAVTITNHGDISGTSWGVYMPSNSGSIAIVNTGTIDGGLTLNRAAAIALTSTGTIEGGVFASSNGAAEIVINGEDDGSPAYSEDGLAVSGTSVNLLVGAEGSISGSDGIFLFGTSAFQATINGDVNGDLVGIAIHAGSTPYTGANLFIGKDAIVSGAGSCGISIGSVIGMTISVAGVVEGGTGIIVNAYPTGNEPSLIDLTNTGTIFDGVNLNASSDDKVVNSGLLSGGLQSGSGDQIANTGTINGGIAANGATTVENAGTIAGGFSDSAAGLITIDNQGSMLGTISGGVFDLTNSGFIHGAITMTGASTLINSGKITGAIDLGGSASSLTNGGLIHGNVTLGAGGTLTNTGTLHGDVVLGAGDTLNTSRGEITGTVTAAKSDTFDFSGAFGHNTILDFVAGGPNHDTVHFASDDFANYAAVQSHMAQVGGNVVITLDAGDTILLEGATLSTLVAHDFTFG